MNKHKKEKTLLILWCNTLKDTIVQYNNWHTEAGILWTDKMIYWLEEGEEMGDGRADGSSAAGDGGQAAISLTSDIDGIRSGSFLLSTLLKKWSSDVWAVALFSCHRWHSSTGLHFEQLLQHLCTVLHFGSCASKTNSVSANKKIPFLSPASSISSVLQLLLPLVSPHPFSGPPIPSGRH